jgi:D-alanine-D-alanine ligase
MSSHRLKVAVLRGGPSSEYDASLASGRAVLANFPERYEPLDVLIDRTGRWHTNGRVRTPESVLIQSDVVFNCLHGEYGEDGQAQRLFEAHGLPYNGARPYQAALAMHKPLAKAHFKQAGMAVPNGMWLNTNNEDHETEFYQTLSEFPIPAVVKPARCGSSVGVTLARDRASLIQGVEYAMSFGHTDREPGQVLVEGQIEGREATCGVIENFRGQYYYALPPVEIIPPKGHEIFGFDIKYNDASQLICPARFPSAIKQRIEELAVRAHRTLGLRHYSRSDFIVADDAIYLLETNALPGLTEHSLLPKELAAVGSSLGQFVEHVLDLALARR